MTTRKRYHLMRAFVEAGVKPYYLHHGDLAPGTAHWRVSIARGQELMRLLRARLSGLATPTYMLDIPGGRGKVPIGPQWLHSGDNKEHVVTDPQEINTFTPIGWARAVSAGCRNLSGPAARAPRNQGPTNCISAGSLPCATLSATLLATTG